VIPAARPRPSDEGRLLHVDPERRTLADLALPDLPGRLCPGDLLVVNDAATLPASLVARTDRGPVEVRLLGPSRDDADWQAVLFGEGTWRDRTEDRRPPPILAAGDRLALGGGLPAVVTAVHGLSPRLVNLSFDRSGAELWSALYAAGRPVQYSYLTRDLALVDVQTPIAGRPWAAEMPSAARTLTVSLLQALRARGVRLAALTHAAGLSATGDPVLDAALPLAERYEIPEATVAAVAEARLGGGRVVAVGTTVVRALEGSAAQNRGEVRAGVGVTDLRIGSSHVPEVVDGLLSGLHEPGSSHFELLSAFAPRAFLEAAARHAETAGYLAHEFGDACLVLPARAGWADCGRVSRHARDRGLGPGQAL
jgi:S-adenosylmethionine:tRNA ribosyltransferase-isomerase